MRLVNFHTVLSVLSRLLMLETVALLSCLPFAIYFHEPLSPFLWSALITLSPALILMAVSGRKKLSSMGIREGYLSVVLSWITISLFGIFPYIISRTIPGFIDPLFESASGFTTTGSSILENIEALPKSILYWRSLTHWVGGVGVILLVIIILPTLNIGGYRFFTMESSIQGKTHPRIKTMVYRLLWIYIALTAGEVILLLMGGMNLYESLCHAYGTIATGGFSPKNTSIALYSPYIQYIVMIFMILSGMNFVLHYHFIKGNYRKISENEELRFYLLVIFISGAIITGVLYLHNEGRFEPVFRESFFQVISVLTSTGFATADYLKWPTFAWILIFLLMFIGGSTGSTSGGIKMARHLVVLKNVRLIFRNILRPNSINILKLNGEEIPEKRNIIIISFVMLYIIIFLFSTLIMTGLGVSPETSAGSVITVMGNIGPGLGPEGPVGNFAVIPQAGKLLLTLLMFIGRLEIFTFMVLFIPSFWRN